MSHNSSVNSQLSAILNFTQLADFASEENIMQYALEQSERLSNSSIGYFHFVHDDQKTIKPCLWSNAKLQHRDVEEKEKFHLTDKAGALLGCLKDRRTIICNDYQRLTKKNDRPDRQVKVIREMAVPVIDSDKIVAILGVGNKPTDYDQHDEETITIFAKTAWHLIQKKRFTVELEKSQQNLEETNIALKVILDKRNEAKENLENQILKNISDQLNPYLTLLKKISSTNEQQALVGILESNIKNITSPFSRDQSSIFTKLSPLEIQVADLIKQEMRTKEIAEILNLSPGTISVHRKNIRRKLGLSNKGVNLYSFLSSYS